ncbi:MULTISPECIES: hypothetical protein [Synechocystis]|uniref:Transposase n=1 Tax=Synechocystis salina LEGE 00031 TaxID=1828736 RepID=A0ABR9VQ12_9SYNC|nr:MULTISPECIES: hypothetical protein [Synechocystis]MBE9240205.1 hypothetical protein [Synechocystis salina LEGE 00041]MBE9253429.1 hypothetical protein [Synechocystis salina LEGE 00031]
MVAKRAGRNSKNDSALFSADCWSQLTFGQAIKCLAIASITLDIDGFSWPLLPTLMTA